MTALSLASNPQKWQRLCLPKGMCVLAILVCLVAGHTGCSHDDGQSLPGDGQWRVINWWAVWCGPCRDEIPELNALAKDPTIQVLGVNFDQKVGEALKVDRERLRIEFPTLRHDPAEQLGVPRPTVLPTTLVVNPEGVVIATLVGPQTQGSLRAHIKRLPTEG